MSCGVGRRHGSDPVLLCLWCRLAAAAPIGPLAWEPPYATGVTLEKEKKKRQKTPKKQVALLQTKNVHIKGNHQQNKKAT